MSSTQLRVVLEFIGVNLALPSMEISSDDGESNGSRVLVHLWSRFSETTSVAPRWKYSVLSRVSMNIGCSTLEHVHPCRRAMVSRAGDTA